jgi:hypothetical protein
MGNADDYEVVRSALGRDRFALWFEPRSPRHPAVIDVGGLGVSRDFITDLADAFRTARAPKGDPLERIAAALERAHPERADAAAAWLATR